MHPATLDLKTLCTKPYLASEKYYYLRADRVRESKELCMPLQYPDSTVETVLGNAGSITLTEQSRCIIHFSSLFV
jgi:hypothetical protein